MKLNLFKASIFLFGTFLPLPFFLSVSSGGLAPANGYGTPGLAVVPLSAFTLPTLLPFLAKHIMKYCLSLVRHWHSGAITVSVVVIIGILIPVSLIAGTPAFLFTVQIVTPLAVLLLAYLLVTDLNHYLEIFLIGYFWGVIFSTMFVAIAIMTGFAEISTKGMMPRFYPPLPGMYQLGNYTPSGMIFSGLLGLALSQFYSLSRKRILVACCIVLILSGGTLFGSRESAILLLLAVTVTFIYNVRSFLAWAGALCAVGGASIYWYDGPPVQLPRNFTRLLATGDPTDSSGLSRLNYLETRGVSQFQQSPFFGDLLKFGDETSQVLDRISSHNTYVDILVDYGLFGGLPFFIVFLCLLVLGSCCFFSLFLQSLQGRRDTLMFILSASVLLSILVSANVRLPFHQWYTAFILYTTSGFLLGFATSENQR